MLEFFQHLRSDKKLFLIILVAALGYFVDMYDLVLFTVIRQKSLLGIGVSQADLYDKGVLLINCQMGGMLIGGILWGILGDKKGRLTVLFGSILLYSIANIANAYVTNVSWYAIIRFLAGVGLAGELGAGITLVSETMSKENRGYGTTFVASVGLSGAIVAALVGNKFNWETSYIIGGIMGLALLLLRVSVVESSMYQKTLNAKVIHGDFLFLFRNKQRFFKYLNCILIAVPVWFVIGILVAFSPELGKALGITEPISSGIGILYSYIGISVADVLAGVLSQLFKTRKKVVFYFLLSILVSVAWCLYGTYTSASAYYIICMIMGAATGFWAVFVTMASEQFGTNIRATVTTTVPNFVRGSLLLLTALFTMAKHYLGFINGAMLIGVLSIVVALWALSQLEETYGKELDYLEE